MVYAAIEDVKAVLKDRFKAYPDDIDLELEFAKTYINSRLADHYSIPFDDVSLYATVPVQIKWITAYLVAYKLWDQATILEGQTDDTAGGKWKDLADRWLDRLVEAIDRLTLDDGTLVSTLSGGPRSHDISADEDVPWFTREQAHSW